MRPPRVRRLLGVLDHQLRPQAEAALEGAAWLAEWVSSAAEGSSRLQGRRFDVVLTQPELPDSTGRELLQHVLSMKSGVPVLFLAQPGDELEAVVALGRGAAGYAVVGPTLPVVLPAVLEHALETVRERELDRRGYELLRQNELREICTNLRHELNNPLTGILGNAEMALANSKLPSTLEHRLRHILQMAVQMRDVLRELERFPDQPGRLHLLETVGRSKS